MDYSLLYIIGNGFDLAHVMATRYADFKQWLIDNDRIDVIHELQSAYPAKMGKDFLLWSDFETALGQYDLEKVINWSWDDLFLTEYSIGGQRFNAPNFFLETQLNHIINSAFASWARHIRLSDKPIMSLPLSALYLTFNYTDTLEELYQIPERQLLHIHGRAKTDEELVVGHNHYIDPSDYWDDHIDLRENNERMQRLCDMNDLCKPYDDLIERNKEFFQQMGNVQDIYVIGHSCGEIDYPYFRDVKASVAKDAQWHFNPYSEEDSNRIDLLKRTIGIQ